MSDRRYVSEQELEAAARRGDPDAIERVVELLEEAHPYTSGRAGEMLAAVPSARRAPVIADAFDEPGRIPHPQWWRVVALVYEDSGRLPEGFPAQRLVGAIERATSDADDVVEIDADVIYQAVRAVRGLREPGRSEALARLARYRDDEIAVTAASWIVADGGSLTDATLDRLRQVSGAWQAAAARLVYAHGGRDVLPALIESLSRGGPESYRTLQVLEDHGDAEARSALRPLWDKRWFVDVVAPRAAAVAAALGDAEALDALRRFSGARKVTVRGVALAELARLGDASDRAQACSVAVSRDAAAAGLLGALARLAGDPDVQRALEEAATSHDDPECRIAAVESLGERSVRAADPDSARATLRAVAERDTDPEVRAAAADALADPNAGGAGRVVD